MADEKQNTGRSTLPQLETRDSVNSGQEKMDAQKQSRGTSALSNPESCDTVNRTLVGIAEQKPSSGPSMSPQLESCDAVNSAGIKMPEQKPAHFPSASPHPDVSHPVNIAENEMGQQQQSPDSSTLPQFEVLERVKNLPVISSAIEKTMSKYSNVKSLHPFIAYSLGRGETGVNRKIAKATSSAVPYVRHLDKELRLLDRKLCQGLDAVEKKVPMVKAPPEKIYSAGKSTVVKYYKYLRHFFHR